MGWIVSVQRGEIETLTRTRVRSERGGVTTEQSWQTAFRKRPIEEAVAVGHLGLDGDAQADSKHHGGPDKAVLLYGLTHYEPWRRQFPHLPLEPGAFGENLTVEGLDESSVCLGDVVQIGDVLLEISQPRVPCWKISERWGEPSLTDAVRNSGHTGWYARVKRPGHVEAGMSVVLVARIYPEWTIERMNDLFFHRAAFTQPLIDELRLCQALAPAWKDHLQDVPLV